MYILNDFHQFSEKNFRNIGQQIVFVNFVIRKLLCMRYLISVWFKLQAFIKSNTQIFFTVNIVPDCIQSFMGIFSDDTKIYCPISSSKNYSILQ